MEAAKATRRVRSARSILTHVTTAWRGSGLRAARRRLTAAQGFLMTVNQQARAGKPMLSQLMGGGVGGKITTVVRYYGGNLLGTGGLVKA
ncbi:YigZ family protein [Shigella flexneri]